MNESGNQEGLMFQENVLVEFTEFSEITEVISQTSRGKKEVGHAQWKRTKLTYVFSAT